MSEIDIRNLPISIFGETAKRINEGDKFIAHVRSVEGRKVVDLKINGHDGKLHRIHKLTDYGISVFAGLGLVGMAFGFEEIINTWFNVDLYFHLTVLIFLGGGILAERVLHRNKHHW